MSDTENQMPKQADEQPQVSDSRRRLIQLVAAAAIGVTVLPTSWTSPVIGTIVVPAHAAMSFVSFSASGSAGAPLPSPAVSLSVTMTPSSSGSMLVTPSRSSLITPTPTRSNVVTPTPTRSMPVTVTPSRLGM